MKDAVAPAYNPKDLEFKDNLGNIARHTQNKQR